ncbi:MAG: hypothetical protein RIG77_14435 [Cyclobacteriaceae bacterium]
MNKQVVIDSVNEMPQNFELDELFERLLVIEKIERGRADVKQKRTLTHELAKKELQKWLK